MEFMNSWVKIFFGLALGAWFASGAIVASRMQLVFDYTTLPLVPPQFEWIAASAGAFSALAALALLMACGLLGSNRALSQTLVPTSKFSPSQHSGIGIALLAACLPLGLLGLRLGGAGVPQPSWMELFCFALGTGIAVRGICRNQRLPLGNHSAVWLGLLSAAVLSCGGWWYSQSLMYYRDFQLGFNDFAHFSQRISNTANGNGFLLESPVLPPFWDHFNPGLLLLVPLWHFIPHVEGIFALQACCLAGSAWLVAAIALARKQSAASACGWGCAWLLFPSIGQMNLAYTYGWHPITLAIPCLLAAHLFLVRDRPAAAVAFGLLAASFEEGVFVVVACYAASEAIRSWWTHRAEGEPTATDASAKPASKNEHAIRNWLVVLLVSMIGFACVYRFSGLAPFQTARFARLGGSALEIIGSPFLRPHEFWGLLLRPRNLAFTCLVIAPFAVVATRAWLWALLAVLPPWFVLMIWEHMPAQCLAFQYTSCLIPILFAGGIENDSKRPGSSESRACSLLAIGWILSISIGQMPWSNESLVDVKARTYGVQPKWNRTHRGEDAQLLTKWIRSLRGDRQLNSGPPIPDWGQLRVLATGRIAAHCIGARDVETVGQFWQRYEALKALDPKLSSPILRYDVLLLDLTESFQQTPEETKRVLEEATRHGWTVHEQKFDLAFLTRAAD